MASIPFSYTEAQWRAIGNTIPELRTQTLGAWNMHFDATFDDRKVKTSLRDLLENEATAYLISELTEHHPAQDRKLIQEVVAATAMLSDAIEAARKVSPANVSAKWAARTLNTAREADAISVLLKSHRKPALKGRLNSFLEGVLGVWTGALGYRVSTGKDGACVRFLLAASEPVLRNARKSNDAMSAWVRRRHTRSSAFSRQLDLRK